MKVFQWVLGVLARTLLVPAFIFRGYESPGQYGLPLGCKWKQLQGSMDLDGAEAGNLIVAPTECAFFQPKAIYLFGIFPSEPGLNGRFTIGSVTIGGKHQLTVQTENPKGGTDSPELLSDVFNRTDEPLLINWADISNDDGVKLSVFNLNKRKLRIFACIWGVSMSSPGLWGRVKAYFGR